MHKHTAERAAPDFARPFATACLLARLVDLTRGIARTAVRPVVQRADIMSFIYEAGASARAHVLGDENRPFERIQSFHVGLSWTRGAIKSQFQCKARLGCRLGATWVSRKSARENPIFSDFEIDSFRLLYNYTRARRPR